MVVKRFRSLLPFTPRAASDYVRLKSAHVRQNRNLVGHMSLQQRKIICSPVHVLPSKTIDRIEQVSVSFECRSNVALRAVFG